MNFVPDGPETTDNGVSNRMGILSSAPTGSSPAAAPTVRAVGSQFHRAKQTKKGNDNGNLTRKCAMLRRS